MPVRSILSVKVAGLARPAASLVGIVLRVDRFKLKSSYYVDVCQAAKEVGSNTPQFSLDGLKVSTSQQRD